MFKPGEQQFTEFINFLREQRNAAEYVEEGTRQRGVKGKVNMLTEKEEGAEKDVEEESPVQKQMAEIVKGLAHITDLVSKNQFSDRELNKRRNGDSGGKRCFFHSSDGHETSNCSGFSALTVKERHEMTRRHGACFCCLKLGHGRR